MSRRRGRKDKAPAALRLLKRELLRERPAPGDAQHIHLLVSQLLEQPGAEPDQHPWTVREPRRRRAADARHIEHDCLGTVQRVEQRCDRFDARPDPIKEKQRRARFLAAPNSDAQHLPAHLEQADFHLFLHDVSAGRRIKRRVLLAAERGRRRRDLGRARLDPVQPVRPPASAVLCRPLPATLRLRLARRAGPEERLGIAGRIEQALDVAAVGEREGTALSVELRRAVAALPGRDVIGDAGNDITIQLDTAHVERHAATPSAARH